MIGKETATKEEMLRFWDVSFPKEEEFWQDFLDERFNAENVFCTRENGKIVSALYCFDVKIKGSRKLNRVKFLLGISTAPELRAGGRMTRLIEETMSFFSDEKTLFALYPNEKKPFLRDFYRRRGFRDALPVTVYHTPDFSKKTGRVSYSCVDADTGSLNRLYSKLAPAIVKDDVSWRLSDEKIMVQTSEGALAYAIIRDKIMLEASSDEAAALSLLTELSKRGIEEYRVLHGSTLDTLLAEISQGTPLFISGMISGDIEYEIYVPELY